MDHISLDSAAKGLIVLAVDVGESEEEVRKYLQERPRSCRIVLTKDTNLVAKHRPHSYPLYVVFDRDGHVAGTQSGAGGEESLRELLSNAGLDSSPVTAMQSTNGSPSAAQAGIAAKVILVPGARMPVARNAPQPKAQLPTIFVLSTGERLETRQYMLTSDSVRVTVGEQQRTVPLGALDMKATIAANRERGIDLKIPTSRNEIFLGR